MDIEKVEELADYATLRQVRNALWKIGAVHGAAVMVEAGFSQHTDRASDSTPLLPLWPDFHTAMLNELYQEGNGPTDPLILAEEYQTAPARVLLIDGLLWTRFGKNWMTSDTLSKDNMKAILANNHGVTDTDLFIATARKRGVEKLLSNP